MSILFQLTPLIAFMCLATRTTAQLSANASFHFSGDNGTTWQANSISVPATQSSILVRMSVTVLDGVQELPGTDTHFSAANLESYVTTSSPTGDTIASPLVHQVSSPGQPALQPAGFAAGRRVGNILALDRRNDTTPLGSNPAIVVLNEFTSSNGPFRFNPLTVLQYQLNLDGSMGQRSFSSTFLPIVTPAVSVGANQVGVYDYRNTSLVVRAVDVAQVPATLTIIPAPGSILLTASAGLLMLRRRRS